MRSLVDRVILLIYLSIYLFIYLSIHSFIYSFIYFIYLLFSLCKNAWIFLLCIDTSSKNLDFSFAELNTDTCGNTTAPSPAFRRLWSAHTRGLVAETWFGDQSLSVYSYFASNFLFQGPHFWSFRLVPRIKLQVFYMACQKFWMPLPTYRFLSEHVQLQPSVLSCWNTSADIHQRFFSV